jgi:hypothetical protein
MTTKQKLDKFKEISKELIVKEYLGTPNIGKDIEYEEELTNAGADYLMSVFYQTGDGKKVLLEVMKKKDIKYKSNILQLVL